jgi:uncharacterized membrane protein (UPF0182 family)
VRSRRWLLVTTVTVSVLLFIGLPLLNWAARVWTDYLWYDDLGQSAVFVTRIVSQLVVGAAFGLAAFGILYGNLIVARRMAPRSVPIGLPEGTPEQVMLVIEAIRGRIGPWLDRVMLAVAAWLAFLSGLNMSGEWQLFRIALTGTRFGQTDPQFGADIGFYTFVLPALESVASWLTGTLVLTTILALAVHVIDGAIQPWARLRGFAPHVKAHLSVLLAAIVLTRGYSYWLDIWNLNFSPRGQVVGASYTDVHAQLPAYRILIVISIATAIVLLLNIRYKGWRLPLVALGGWITASILLGGVWPALVQQFRVTPNEASLEAPYIERNIRMTRQAFGLTELEGLAFPATEDLTADDVIANRDTLSNVRLWDPQIVQQGYSQLQSIRSYYDFPDVDVDRYRIGGRNRQVLVSARELDTTLLDPKAQNWVNTHLVYTHGFGLVISPVNESDGRGLPLFYVGDIPPRVSSTLATGAASAELETKQPRIYFGEDTTSYVIVNTGKEEFDFPQGETNAFYEYEGDSGPEIGSFVRRIAWALRLGSSQVFFSGYVTPESRVLMNRDITSRAQALAPWLRYEDDPYPVLVDGRIVWVLDAYTHSDNYPYGERLPNGTNYLRNSVKVTIDAFTGDTTFWAFDPNDPVLQAWREVFPTLLTDADRMPDGVRAHLRYPQGLFAAQAEVYRTYHMTNVNVFYNKEDQWQIPGERQGEPMEPFFVLLRLPGASAEHFYIMQPYTPRNRDNMIGWIAASSDPDNYGERTVFLFPKERVILGPEQVSARINQDPLISPQLSLWNQRGSEALFGNMLVIPIEDSIVYIQPLFLRAERTAIPELTRVVVVYADSVEMERTLEAALLRVFGERPSEEETGTAGPPATGGAAADAAAAQQLYEQAIEAQRRGDWSEYGRLIDELGEVLSGLAGQDATGTP